MRVSSVNFGQTALNTSTNSAALKPCLMTNSIKDEFVKTENVSQNKLQFNDAVQKFNEINKENSEKGIFGKKRFSLTETQNFKSLYKKDLIDITTVKKFAKNTELDVKSLSNIYTMGKTLKDNDFSNKVLNAVNEINKTKGNKIVSFNANTTEKTGNEEFVLTFKNQPKTSADVNRNFYNSKTGNLLRETKETYYVKNLEGCNPYAKAGSIPMFMYADRMMKKEINDLQNNKKTVQTFKLDNFSQQYKLEQEITEN